MIVLIPGSFYFGTYMLHMLVIFLTLGERYATWTFGAHASYCVFCLISITRFYLHFPPICSYHGGCRTGAVIMPELWYMAQVVNGVSVCLCMYCCLKRVEWGIKNGRDRMFHIAKLFKTSFISATPGDILYRRMCVIYLIGLKDLRDFADFWDFIYFGYNRRLTITKCHVHITAAG